MATHVFLVTLLAFVFAIALTNAATPCPAEAGLIRSNLLRYAVFSGSGYTFAGLVNSSFINGDMGSFPTSSALSGNTKVTLNGIENLNATETNLAANDVITAYNNGLAKPGRMPISGDIGGLTKTPGVYAAATTIGITGNLTLDAQGDSNAVFVFIAGSALFNDPGTNIILINGAQACHVYWFVGSSATLGARTNWVGTINAYASITIASTSSIDGRLLARQAITIDGSTVTLPACSAPNALVVCEVPFGLTEETSANSIGISAAMALTLAAVAMAF